MGGEGEVVFRFLAVGVIGLCLLGVAAAAPPSIYKGLAKHLIPSADDAGYAQVVSQSGRPLTSRPKPGLLSSWTASYSGGTNDNGIPNSGVGTVGVMVFRTEAAAKAQYEGICVGCDHQRFHGWQLQCMKLQRAGECGHPMPQCSGCSFTSSLTLLARCRNIVVAEANVGSRYGSKAILSAVGDHAVTGGMTACGASSASTPLPPTGSVYWSESQAEENVIRSVKIPACNVSSSTNCAGEPGLVVDTANCRGSDERDSTFTYSRFTCEITVAYYHGGDPLARGHIAVYPTGPTTLRWKII